MKRLTLLLIFLVLLVLLNPAGRAFAHGGEPRLEIGQELLAPGEVLDLRGVDFESEAVITLTLRGNQAEISMGEILADVEGIFLLNYSLPPDLPEGTYTVHAQSGDHEVDSPPFKVQGVAGQQGGEQPVGESDMLLAPMPTLPPGYTSTPVPAAEAAADPQVSFGIARGYLLPGAVILLVALILIAARLRSRARRR
jgi:hypothetical protein